MSAEAQQPCWRLIDLGQIRMSAEFPTFGLNQIGDVVGYYQTEPPVTERHAWVWIAEPGSAAHSSIPRRQLVDLHDHFDHDLGPSMALDLNEEGQVVGQATFSALSHAALWDLRTLEGPCDLGTFGGPQSTAHAIQQLLPVNLDPVVVGVAQVDETCGLPSSFRAYGFWTVIDHAPLQSCPQFTLDMLTDPPLDPDDSAAAFDVRSIDSGTPPSTVGENSDCPSSIFCRPDLDPVHWQNASTPTKLMRLSEDEPTPEGSGGTALGINDDERVAGYCQVPEDPDDVISCLPQGSFWATPTAAEVPDHLGNAAGLDPDQPSRAHALNVRDDLSSVQTEIVGRITTLGPQGLPEDHAALWRRDPGGLSWSAQASDQAVYVSSWQLHEALSQ